jgi:transcription elongation factor SPT4
MSSYNREAERDVDDAGAPGEGLPDQIADLANAQAPSSLRGIRACKVCGILKTLDQFLNEGCENCPFLDIVSDFS